MRVADSRCLVILLSCLAIAIVGCQQKAKGPATSQQLTQPEPAGVQAQPTLQPPGDQQSSAKPSSAGVVRQQPSAVQSAGVEQKGKVSGPRIKFEKTTHDFGQIGPGTKHLCEFPFTNVGDRLLKIEDIGRTCGCTVFTLTKRSYSPGEGGSLRVQYHAGAVPGTTTKHLTVTTNDPVTPKVTLTIKARIVQKVSVEPKRINLLLTKENAGCPEIVLTSLDGQPFSITSFLAPAACITAEFDRSVEATKFVLKPKVDKTKLRHGLSGAIEIGLTHPECAEVTIPFSTLAKYKLNPPLIILFDATASKPITRDLWILNNYHEPFTIESVSSQRGLIKEIGREKIRDGYKLRLRITPPAGQTSLQFTDTLVIGVSTGEQLKVGLRGFFSRNK